MVFEETGGLAHEAETVDPIDLGYSYQETCGTYYPGLGFGGIERDAEFLQSVSELFFGQCSIDVRFVDHLSCAVSAEGYDLRYVIRHHDLHDVLCQYELSFRRASLIVSSEEHYVLAVRGLGIPEFVTRHVDDAVLVGIDLRREVH